MFFRNIVEAAKDKVKFENVTGTPLSSVPEMVPDWLDGGLEKRETTGETRTSDAKEPKLESAARS